MLPASLIKKAVKRSVKFMAFIRPTYKPNLEYTLTLLLGPLQALSHFSIVQIRIVP